MKINKKILCALVLAPATLLASCGGNTDNGGVDWSTLSGTYDITMWVSETEGVKESFTNQVKAFEKLHEKDNIKINLSIEGVSEKDSATQMLTDVEAGADIFCFAQDQFSRLVQGGALNKLGNSATQFVKENNTADSVNAVTSGNAVYAYPLTADNGYFMYYDKRIIKEADVDDLGKLIQDCEDAGKKFSFEMGTSAWYLASFFFGAGCHSNWSTSADGTFTAVDDDWNSDKGVIAARGIQQLVQSTAHNSSSDAADFSAATPSAILVSGTWAYNSVKTVLGDNMGVADLPSYTVDGKSYHLGSFSGYKLMGVKPQTDAKKAAIANQLAQYLTNADNQTSRAEEFGWGPSNKVAVESDIVKNNPALAALAQQNAYATPQGQIHGSWWDIAKVIGDSLKTATKDDVTAIKAVLKTYEDAIKNVLTLTPEVLRAFTVIGSMGGDGWKTDIAMTEAPENTWTSGPITFAANDEFKVRQGLSWDVAFGDADGQNFKVTEACTKKVQLVTTIGEDGKVASGVVSLID